MNNHCTIHALRLLELMCMVAGMAMQHYVLAARKCSRQGFQRLHCFVFRLVDGNVTERESSRDEVRNHLSRESDRLPLSPPWR